MIKINEISVTLLIVLILNEGKSRNNPILIVLTYTNFTCCTKLYVYVHSCVSLITCISSMYQLVTHTYIHTYTTSVSYGWKDHLKFILKS